MMKEKCQRFKLVTALWACVGALFCGAVAQETGGDFQRLRKDFTKARSERLAPQLARYIRKLAELERASVERGDYGLAGQIRDELDQAAAKWCAMTGTARGAFELSPSDAEVAGGVRAIGPDLTGWGNKGGSASWRLPPGVLAGAYAITIEYGAPGGRADARFNGGRHQLERTLEPTDTGKLEVRELKPLLLTANASSFTVNFQGASIQNLILRKVALKRLEADPSLRR